MDSLPMESLYIPGRFADGREIPSLVGVIRRFIVYDKIQEQYAMQTEQYCRYTKQKGYGFPVLLYLCGSAAPVTTAPHVISREDGRRNREI